MRNLLNPRWLLIINTLPIVVLFVLFFGQFNIIKTLLDDNSIRLWKIFGLALGVLGLLNFAYTVYAIFKKQNVSVWYAMLALLCYIPFMYLYGYHFDKIIPFSIPQWMVSRSFFLYVGTFLMPTLTYALFVLVVQVTSADKTYKAWVNFLIAIGIPVGAYLFAQIILPLWQKFDIRLGEHAFLILMIVAILVFLFFLIRGVFILVSHTSETWQKYQLAWKIPIAIVLPLLGLLINNGLFFNDFGKSGVGIFGDFNDPWFYILAVVNGIFICLPNLDNKFYRLFLWIARSVSLAYTLYFFLVFLPFLPLSIIAILLFAVGFLMLTPLVLFVVHVNELSKDFSYLKTMFSKQLLVGVSVLGFLLIPASITATYLQDKSVLHETLSYVYSPDYSKSYGLDKKSLQKTLNIIKNHKMRRNVMGGLFSYDIPYLTSYFNWLVMDNLTLSETKINAIEQIFFDKDPIDFSSENIRNKDVEISDIATTSTYDSTQKAWKSRVNLEITNNRGGAWSAEYATRLELPEGCWISDYYLYVGDKKEPGILAEKKSAMWVFSQIRNENKDPGILYYTTGNTVVFRVFPFAPNEVRKTGIEFLHKEPVTLKIDDHSVTLGNREETVYDTMETDNVVYVSAQQKRELKSVKRKPYFHFLIDVSKDQNANVNDFTDRIEQVLAMHKSLAENAKVSYVNTYVRTFSLDDNWTSNYKNQTFEGGFYLDRALRTLFFEAYQNQSDTYPVPVVVTDSIWNAVLDKDFADFKFAFPESDLFFNLDKQGVLQEHSLLHNPVKELPELKRECQFCETVLAYQLPDNSVVYLPDDNQPSIILKKSHVDVPESEIKAKHWLSALAMQGQWMSQVLHPETSDKEWLTMVKYSFISQVMTPVTSYLVVENDAQKAILKKKQAQVLSGHKSLDLDEDTRRMSEPGLVVLIVLLVIVLGLRACSNRLRGV